MNRLFCLGVAFLFTSFVGICQSATYRLWAEAPTIEQEATSIWRTINDIEFLQQHGYTINLPEHPLINSLLEKSKNGHFGNEDFPVIYSIVEDLYDEENYKAAIQKVNAEIPLLDNLINTLDDSRKDWDWNFNRFKQYHVTFTLYGTGGSYDPDAGRITMLTNKTGGFMRYENPANTIIHEIVHMGIEHLIQKYKVPHPEKERIVDRFVVLMFGKELKEYKVQNMGNTEIDELLAQRSDLQTLPAVIQQVSGD